MTMGKSRSWLAIVLASAACLFAVAAGDSSVVDLSDYPSILYIATPFTVCFGALLTEQTVITDARCLYPFSNSSAVPSSVSSTLKPDYLMAVVPSVNTSSTLHQILLSTQVYPNASQAEYRATTFLSLIPNFINNQTFLAVNSSAVHAYYPQTQYESSSEQNFDVGIVTLTVPVKNAQPVSLQLDDLDASTANLFALNFGPQNPTKDPATLQNLYNGIDLTKATKSDVTTLKRSECDSNYLKAYGLKDMKSFHGHNLPGNSSPIYCSSIYSNATVCKADSTIAISNTAQNINSANLNSTIFLISSGSSSAPKLVSVGLPHLYEVRSASKAPCSSNGFINFPRTGLYTDWIGWATKGSIASNGSWVNKTKTGNDITDYNASTASQSVSFSVALASVLAMLAAAIASL
ncbi:hypothetical protein GQ54DRAFT_284875 [Martensiomyces pterosporus]|nr:hypothetical protein GQ54DRAFT_284875 [Martensiomyces pterosporus]